MVIYINHGIDVLAMSNSDQQLTDLIKNQYNALSFYETIVYAKCDRNLRLNLCEEINSISTGIDRPWLIW